MDAKGIEQIHSVAYRADESHRAKAQERCQAVVFSNDGGADERDSGRPRRPERQASRNQTQAQSDQSERGGPFLAENGVQQPKTRLSMESLSQQGSQTNRYGHTENDPRRQRIERKNSSQPAVSGDDSQRNHCRHQRGRPDSAEGPERQRPERVELFFRAESPRQIENSGGPFCGDKPRVGVGQKSGKIMEKAGGAASAPLKNQHHGDVEGDGGVIERPNAQGAADVKVSERNAAELFALAKQQSGDQESADHEENVNAVLALTENRHGLKLRVIRRAPPTMKPNHTHDAEGAKAIERTKEANSAKLLVACGCIHSSGFQSP